MDYSDAPKTAFVTSNVHDFAFLLDVRVAPLGFRHPILLVNLEMVACNRYRDGNSVNVRKCGELGALAKVPGYSMRKWQRKGC